MSGSQSLLRGAVAAFVVRSGGVAAQLLNLVLLTRLFGSVSVGAFAVCHTVCGFVANAGVAGTDVLVAREVAASTKSDSGRAIRGLGRIHFRLVLLALATSSLALALGAGVLFRVLNANYLSPFTATAVVVAVLMGVNLSIAGWLLGFREIAVQVAVRNAFVFLVSAVVVVISALIGVEDPVRVAVAGLAVGYVASVVLGAARLAHVIRDHRVGQAWGGTPRSLAVDSAPILGINLINFAIAWVDVLLLSAFTSAYVVGVYAVASRMAAMVTMILMSVNAVAPPIFAAQHARQDVRGMQSTAHESARYCLAGSLGLGLALVFWGSDALRVFTPEVAVAGFYPLVILVAGRVVGSGAGSVGYLLMMSERQRILSWIALGTVILGLVTGILTIPRYGAVGAAVTTAVMTTAYNVGGVAAARLTLGVWSVSDRLAQNFAAALAAIAVFVFLSSVTGRVPAGFVGLAVYGLGILNFARDARRFIARRDSNSG